MTLHFVVTLKLKSVIKKKQQATGEDLGLGAILQ